jgi:L,D-transpeptidase-like protein
MKMFRLFSILLVLSLTLLSLKPDSKTIDRLKLKSIAAKTYCKSNNYNTELCILIDMSLHSGKHRAFLWDMKKDSILASGMCAHGCGANPWGATTTKEKPTFSNTPDSHCSSVGKFKIGKRGYSSWGINVNYKLHGLESTNNNALKREIVLHSWEDVTEQEIYPAGTPEGWGCPAVSNAFMKIIDPKLKASSLPVLLWMFE